jgi:hypothetical protein
MSEQRKTGRFSAALFAAAAMATPVMAADSGQSLASADPDARQVLALLDQARSGKVSRRDYMNAMAAEYTKLAGPHDSAGDTTAPRISTASAPHR